jgi:uncharacterized membrane-anchored protein YhcB (DUF1043 family)
MKCKHKIQAQEPSIIQKQQRLHRWNAAISVAFVVAGAASGFAAHRYGQHFREQRQLIVELQTAKDRIEKQAPELRVRAAERLSICTSSANSKQETKQKCNDDFNKELAKIENEGASISSSLGDANIKNISWGLGLPLILGFISYLIAQFVNDEVNTRFLRQHRGLIIQSIGKKSVNGRESA